MSACSARPLRLVAILSGHMPEPTPSENVFPVKRPERLIYSPSEIYYLLRLYVSQPNKTGKSERCCQPSGKSLQQHVPVWRWSVRVLELFAPHLRARHPRYVVWSILLCNRHFISYGFDALLILKSHSITVEVVSMVPVE